MVAAPGQGRRPGTMLNQSFGSRAPSSRHKAVRERQRKLRQSRLKKLRESVGNSDWKARSEALKKTKTTAEWAAASDEGKKVLEEAAANAANQARFEKRISCKSLPRLLVSC